MRTTSITVTTTTSQLYRTSSTWITRCFQAGWSSAMRPARQRVRATRSPRLNARSAISAMRHRWHEQ
eukprot:7991364-Heterocapsa_arctica.AAC.1